MADTVIERIELDAPIQEVWDVVMDPHRLGDWVTAHREVKDVPDGDLEIGSEFGQKLGVGPLKFSVTWTVKKLDAPNLTEWEGKGPAGSKAFVRYAFSEGEGCKTVFDYENRYEIPGGPAGRMAAKAVNAAVGSREARASLANLQKLLGG